MLSTCTKNKFHTQTVIVNISLTKKHNVPVHVYMVAFPLQVLAEEFDHFLSQLCAFVWVILSHVYVKLVAISRSGIAPHPHFHPSLYRFSCNSCKCLNSWSFFMLE